MQIIYASCLISRNVYKDWFTNTSDKPGQQVQKYHRLIAEGFIHNDVRVTTVSAPPITRSNCTGSIISRKPETVQGVDYRYLTTVNFPVIKNLWTMIESFFLTARLCLNDKQSVVVCDILNKSVAAGALMAAKLTRRINIGIVTDLPEMLGGFSGLNNCILAGFSRYVFLTQQMNGRVNRKNKPYTVIEGQVDIHMEPVLNKPENKYAKKVCLYAGAIHKIYGIETITQAFLLCSMEDAELHIYGSGDYSAELEELCKTHKNIRYFGVVDNDDVVKEQMKASLLINPRPSCEEFTKYSFPSKNMEYMASGTPTLTTNLPGMPAEYRDFVYLFEDETVIGMSKTLSSVLSKSCEELYQKGKAAKEFVLANKNNQVQARKILDQLCTR